MRRLNRPLTAFVGVLMCSLALISPGSGSAQTLASPGAGTWWDQRAAPDRYDRPTPALSGSLHWTPITADAEWAELDIDVSGGPLRVHVILVRFLPSAFRAALVTATDASRVRGSWIVDSAHADVRIAVNAGQFAEAGPWGWIVRDGREIAPPGSGPLAAAVAFTGAGAVRWLDAAGITAARQAIRGPGAAEKDPVQTAFQSYPRLLERGIVVPAILTGQGVDAGHRDARLAIGQLRDGRMLLALTRFGRRESAVSRVPIGLTLSETAGLMGSLGCAEAMMLDGGLSAQMMIRPRTGAPLLWRGARRVPVALVFTDR